MLIGIDFDNTIVRYDRLFYELAVERGLIPGNTPANKTAVRDYLRAAGREDDWTELQGVAYGPEIVRAELFPGVAAFLQACRARNVPVAIVSHKTRHPYRGEKHDLHESARRFLEAKGLLDTATTGLGPSNVFFELTKEDKLARIGAAGCTHFVDDLPEFLAEARFPIGVERILFDPEMLYPVDDRWRHIGRWDELPALLFPTSLAAISNPQAPDREALSRLAHAAGLPDDHGQLDAVGGGGNNRGYCWSVGGRRLFLKWYFRHPGDPRDRLNTEYSFAEFCWRHGVRDVPQPIVRDDDAGMALYEFIDGRRLKDHEINTTAVDAAIDFYRRLNALRNEPDARQLPAASEACFSVAEHELRIGRRVQALADAANEPGADAALASFVKQRLIPAWCDVGQQIDAVYPTMSAEHSTTLAAAARCLSPSDFGFHNALQTADSRLRFIDLEYAGWDDPAKLACDFFCQVQLPAPRALWPKFIGSIADNDSFAGEFIRRATTLLAAYRVKWCCIVLNIFLPTGSARRAFGTAQTATPERKAAQLEKAANVLDQLPNDLAGKF